MVANFTKSTGSTEQDLITNLDDFLVNHVGWYRIDTISDTASDRDYVWMSDGEPDRYLNTYPRIIRARAWNNNIYLYTYETYTNSSTFTGQTGDTANTLLGGSSSFHRSTFIADKERIIISLLDINGNRYQAAYLGRVDSFIGPELHPYPNMSRGNRFTTTVYGGTDTYSRGYCYTPQSNYQDYFIIGFPAGSYGHGPGAWNHEYLAAPFIVYFTDDASDLDLMGVTRGVYDVSQTIPDDYNMTLASGTFKVFKASSSSAAFGPLTDSRIGDINREPPNQAEVDYTYRGFQTLGDTLCNWRLDELSGGVYQDQTGDYDLTPVNSPTLTSSPLVNSLDFNGSTQRLTGTGDASAASALVGEWTCEMVFMPDTIPGSGKDTLIEFGSSGDGVLAENILLSISLTPSGNINILWETDGSGTDESNTTSSDFILEDRWNYLAIVKKSVGGGNYDLEVWHSSFGDHNVVLRETFSSVPNASGGTASDWVIGADSTFTDFFDGKIDAVVISTSAKSKSELDSTLKRVRL